MKLRRYILFKTILMIIFMIFVTSFTINILYTSIDVSNEEYIDLLLSDTFNDNIYSKIVDMFTKINPTYIINIPEYNKPYVSDIISDDGIIYIYNTDNMEYKNKLNYIPNTSLAAYLLSFKLNELGVSTIYENNTSIKNVKYSFDIGTNEYKYFNKILVTINCNLDNVFTANLLSNKINSNKNIISKVYLTDEDNIKINIGSVDDDFVDVINAIDVISLSIKEVL